MEYSLQLSVDERVRLTASGSRAHREHHLKEKAIAGAIKTANPITWAVTDAIANMNETVFQPDGATGTIVDKRKRWWGKSGYDYKVAWDPQSGGGASWHLGKHLEKLSEN